MSLPSGTRLAHYEVLELIGKGGMGEVYRAKDSKLGRDVAIKVLPDELAQDEERLRRFQREAKVLASLNHPNIASIYGLEQSESLQPERRARRPASAKATAGKAACPPKLTSAAGAKAEARAVLPEPHSKIAGQDGTNKSMHYLVLELVPGETLAERIARGPIPLEEALEIAVKVAEALEEAAEKGIVHRDLKPANIKLTEDGKVKVLDFGLAKAFAEDVSEVDSSLSPTITRGTQVGVILGTAAYMSPEQAKGKRVDKRTDIFAFGAVVYEMLTGHKPFPGENVSEVLAAVIKSEPDWSAISSRVPAGVSKLLRRCLQKDAKQRLHDIADARLELEEALRSGGDTPFVKGPGLRSTRTRAGLLLLGAGLLAAAFALGRMREPQSPPPVRRVAIPLTNAHVSQGDRAIDISDDGSRITYLEGLSHPPRVAVRDMDSFEPVVSSVSEAGVGPHFPFFAPGGDTVGFFAEGAIKKLDASGGVTTVAPAPRRRGADWGDDGTIVFGDVNGLTRAAETGGAPESLTELDSSEGAHAWPHMLPGSKAVLFTVESTTGERRVDVLVLESGTRRPLVQNATDARYSPTGHIVFAREASLFAAPFDLDRIEIVGPEVQVLESLRVSPSGSASFTISQDGTLVYMTEGLFVSAELTWVSREGIATTILDGYRFSGPRLSPDGGRIAVSMRIHLASATSGFTTCGVSS